MTNEVAIEILEMLKIRPRRGSSMITAQTAVNVALQTGINALYQRTKKGHWIVTAEEYYKAINEKGGGVNENTPEFITGIDVACSECLERYNFIDNEPERFYYCPNCGRY